MVDRVRRLGWGDHIFFHNIRDRQSLRVYHPCNHYHRWLRPPELRPDLMTGVLVKILGRKDHKNAKKSFIIVLTLERHSFYQKKRKTVRNVLTQLFLLPCIEERRHLWLSFNKWLLIISIALEGVGGAGSLQTKLQFSNQSFFQGPPLGPIPQCQSFTVM